MKPIKANIKPNSKLSVICNTNKPIVNRGSINQPKPHKYQYCGNNSAPYHFYHSHLSILVFASFSLYDLRNL